MKEAGWEIASHGLKWIEYKDATPEVEAAEDAAFDSFFHTDLEHDKSRDWILSDAR